MIGAIALHHIHIIVKIIEIVIKIGGSLLRLESKTSIVRWAMRTKNVAFDVVYFFIFLKGRNTIGEFKNGTPPIRN